MNKKIFFIFLLFVLSLVPSINSKATKLNGRSCAPTSGGTGNYSGTAKWYYHWKGKGIFEVRVKFPDGEVLDGQTGAQKWNDNGSYEPYKSSGIERVGDIQISKDALKSATDFFKKNKDKYGISSKSEIKMIISKFLKNKKTLTSGGTFYKNVQHGREGIPHLGNDLLYEFDMTSFISVPKDKFEGKPLETVFYASCEGGIDYSEDPIKEYLGEVIIPVRLQVNGPYTSVDLNNATKKSSNNYSYDSDIDNPNALNFIKGNLEQLYNNSNIAYSLFDVSKTNPNWISCDLKSNYTYMKIVKYRNRTRNHHFESLDEDTVQSNLAGYADYYIGSDIYESGVQSHKEDIYIYNGYDGDDDETEDTAEDSDMYEWALMNEPTYSTDSLSNILSMKYGHWSAHQDYYKLNNKHEKPKKPTDSYDDYTTKCPKSYKKNYFAHREFSRTKKVVIIYYGPTETVTDDYSDPYYELEPANVQPGGSLKINDRTKDPQLNSTNPIDLTGSDDKTTVFKQSGINISGAKMGSTRKDISSKVTDKGNFNKNEKLTLLSENLGKSFKITNNDGTIMGLTTSMLKPNGITSLTFGSPNLASATVGQEFITKMQLCYGPYTGCNESIKKNSIQLKLNGKELDEVKEASAKDIDMNNPPKDVEAKLKSIKYGSYTMGDDKSNCMYIKMRCGIVNVAGIDWKAGINGSGSYINCTKQDYNKFLYGSDFAAPYVYTEFDVKDVAGSNR